MEYWYLYMLNNLKMEQAINVMKVATAAQLRQVHAIRTAVFVIEQACPPELEWEHEEVSHHFLASFNGTPAGAARWRRTDKGYKLERFAVLQQFRGAGVAGALVQAVLADLPPDASYIYLHAQQQATGLYERFGFSIEGAPFEEAGIMHFKMVRL